MRDREPDPTTNPAPLEPGPRDSLPVEAWASDADAKAAEDAGSTFVGFLAGFVCGVASLALFFRSAKRRTRIGILWGVALQMAVLVVVIAFMGDRLRLH